MPIQPDPKYFDWGGQFLQGRNTAQENQRRNQLANIEQGQFGLQQRRQGLAEDQYAQQQAAQQAQAAQHQQMIPVYAKAFEEVGLDPALANDPDAGELYAEIAKQKITPKAQGQLYKTGPHGIYQTADQAVGQPAYNEPNAGPNAPAGQLEYQFYNQLPPEEQKRFLEVKRGYAGPEGAAAVAGAKAGAVQGAKNRADAQTALPVAENNAQNTLDVLDTFEKSPGFNWVYGVRSMAPVVPGTPQADAIAIWEQLQGKAFLEAFNTLKGGGQITEVEGKKATSAMTRLANREQSPAAARVALKELRAIIGKGLAVARKKATQGAPAAQGNRLQFDANGDPVK